jgi:hypothetical protein
MSTGPSTLGKALIAWRSTKVLDLLCQFEIPLLLSLGFHPKSFF